MALPVVFKRGTRAEYNALQEKATNALYFLEDTGEIFHGVKNLAKGKHFEIEFDAAKHTDDISAIEEAIAAVKDAVAVVEDIAVVKHPITGGKFSYTSYVYDGTNWKAMDGNYNAENVYFNEDIAITTAVGNITLNNGSGVIPAAGKNLKDIFQALWTKENYNPTVTNPEISISLDKTSAEGEVGTAFTAPTATASISKFGSFQFGSKDVDNTFYSSTANSDVVFSSLKVGAANTAAALTDANSTSIADIASNATTKSVSYTGVDGIFADAAQTQKFSASATHGGSSRKGVSNLGNFVNAAGTEKVDDYVSAGKGIAANAGTMTKNGTAVFTATGYRAWFMGMLDSVPAVEDIDSAFIRGLTNKGKVSTTTFEIKPGEAAAKSVIVAIPEVAGSLTAAVLTSSMNTGILEDYTKNQVTVQVADASEAEGTEVAYTVYWYKPAALGSDEVHKLTVTKK